LRERDRLALQRGSCDLCFCICRGPRQSNFADRDFAINKISRGRQCSASSGRRAPDNSEQTSLQNLHTCSLSLSLLRARSSRRPSNNGGVLTGLTLLRVLRKHIQSPITHWLIRARLGEEVRSLLSRTSPPTSHLNFASAGNKPKEKNPMELRVQLNRGLIARNKQARSSSAKRSIEIPN